MFPWFYIVPLLLVGLALYLWTLYRRYRHYSPALFLLMKAGEKLVSTVSQATATQHHIQHRVLISSLEGGRRLIVPYKRRLIVRMEPLRVEAYYGTRAEDYTQAPGIPYLFTCNDLEADAIRVFNMDSGKERWYKEDEEIGLAEELL